MLYAMKYGHSFPDRRSFSVESKLYHFSYFHLHLLKFKQPQTFSLPSAELHRVCTEGQASATLHPQEPLPVQDLVVCHVPALWVCHLCAHHAQYRLTGHEVQRGARNIHPCPWHTQPYLHCCVCPWVRPQNHGLQIQGGRLNVSLLLFIKSQWFSRTIKGSLRWGWIHQIS